LRAGWKITDGRLRLGERGKAPAATVKNHVAQNSPDHIGVKLKGGVKGIEDGVDSKRYDIGASWNC